MWNNSKSEEKKINSNTFREKTNNKIQYSDTLQNIRVVGNSIRKDNLIDINVKKNLVPYQNTNKLIDRYDGRHILNDLIISKPENLIIKEKQITENDNILNYYRYNCIIESMKNNISEEECIENVKNNIENNILCGTCDNSIKKSKFGERENYSPSTINQFGEKYLINNYSSVRDNIINPKSNIERKIEGNEQLILKQQQDKITTYIIQQNQPILVENVEEIDLSLLSPMELMKYKTKLKLSQITISSDTDILKNVNRSSPNSNHPFKFNIMEPKSTNKPNKPDNNINVNKINRKRKRDRNKNKNININNNSISENEQIQSHLEYQNSKNTTSSYCFNIYDKRHKLIAN